MQKRFFFGLATYTFSSLVCAANYYVDSINGIDGRDGKSPSTAWKSFSSINSKTFAAGDQILFKRGQSFAAPYALDIKGSGVAVGAYGTGASPKLQNTGAEKWGCVIQISSGNSVKVQDLEVTNTTGRVRESGVCLNGSGHQLSNMDINRVGLGVTVRGSQHRVADSYIHDLTMIVNTPGGDDDYGASAFFISKASNIQIDHNRFERLRASSYDYGYDGSVLEFWNGSDTVQFSNNIVRDSNTLTEAGGNSAAEVVRNITYHHNITVNNSSLGWFHLAGGGSNFGIRISNIRFDNNTFVKTSAGQGDYAIGFTSPPPANTVFIRNNIFHYRNAKGLVYQAGGTVHQTNLYYLSSVGSIGYSLNSKEINGAPQFVNLAGADFHLKSGSPAIDSGSALGYVLDYDGTKVGTGTGPDRGALEFAGPAAAVADAEEVVAEVSAAAVGGYCGDGVVQTPNNFGEKESCDDGNNFDGDRCPSNCTAEN